MRFAAPLAGTVLLVACLSAPTAARSGETTVAGRASVVNGDMIEVDGNIVHLHGIDAPETGQRCGKADGGSWPCGNRATEDLEAMAEDRDVECAIVRNEEDDQMFGICTAGNLLLNRSMVAEGYAWAVSDGAEHYSPAEAEARAANLGIRRAVGLPVGTVGGRRARRTGRLSNKGHSGPRRASLSPSLVAMVRSNESQRIEGWEMVLLGARSHRGGLAGAGIPMTGSRCAWAPGKQADLLSPSGGSGRIDGNPYRCSQTLHAIWADIRVCSRK